MLLPRPAYGRLFTLVVCFSLFLSPTPLFASATPITTQPSQEPLPVDNPPDGTEPVHAAGDAARVGSEVPMQLQAVAGGAIQPVELTAAGALDLANAMMMTPSQLTSARFVEVPDNGTPHALVSSLSFFPTNGQTAGLLTTGNALLADTPNDMGSSGANLGMSSPARGATAYDVTTMELVLAPPAGANCLRLDFAFYSEEFPEYVGSSYNDALIAELNDSTWTAATTINAPNNFAFDKAGHEISINGIDQTNVYTLTASGTTYDGATALLEAATVVGSGAQTLYLSILDQGDNVFDSAALIDNIRFEKVNDTATECVPGARRKHAPLIFVPGVGGTRMNNSEGELWPNPQRLFDDSEDKFLLPLRLNVAGTAPLTPGDPLYTSVATGDIIRSDEVHLPWYVKQFKGIEQDQTVDVYATTIRLLEEAGYEEDVDLYVFPYDWRKSVSVNAEALLQKIDAVRAATGAPKVDILAHSLGGVVSRAVLEDPDSKGKVNVLVTLGTPVLGAAKILAVLRYKATCFIESDGYCLTDINTLEKLITNFPSAYELLPSRNYQKAVGSPLTVTSDLNDDGKPDGPRSYEQWLADVTARNGTLGPSSTTFHDKYDKLDLVDPDVRYVRVVGDQLATISTIEQYRKCAFGSMLCSDENYTAATDASGDGTVPSASADLYVPDKNFDLRGNGINAYAHGVEHGDLPKSEMVISFALAYFNNTDTSASAQELAMRAVAMAEETPAMGLEPLPIDGVLIEVMGNASAALFNALGFAGMLPGDGSPGALDTLPGVTYFAIGDTQTLFIRKGIDVQSFLDAFGNDQLSIQVTRWTHGTPAERALFATQISATDELSFTLASGQPLNTISLLVDTNGDGTAERTLLPIMTDPAKDDSTAPTVSAKTQAYDESHALVTLVANDAGGAGVNSIWYAVDADATTLPYAQPLRLAEGQKLRFMAVDNAGNTSAVQQIVIAEQYGQVRLPIIRR